MACITAPLPVWPLYLEGQAWAVRDAQEGKWLVGQVFKLAAFPTRNVDSVARLGFFKPVAEHDARSPAHDHHPVIVGMVIQVAEASRRVREIANHKIVRADQRLLGRAV
jgi:hypothetical protein